MKIEGLVFLDSVSFLPCALRNLPKAFVLQALYRGNPTNLTLRKPPLSGPYARHGLDDLSGGVRNDFLAWYKTHKSELFDNRYVLEAYIQDDVTILRQVCRVFDASSTDRKH